MRPVHKTITLDTADRNGISVAQTPSAASNLTITGALATGGVATMDVARHVSIYSDGDESGDTYTITGTDRHGDALTEEITGPDTTTVKGSSNFLTVTQVATDGAGTGNIEVGSADEADTQLIPTDVYRDTITYGVDLTSGADLTSELKYTVDDVFDESFSAETANYIADLGPSNGDYDGVSSGPITGVRIQVTGFTSGTVNFHIITSDK